MTKDAVAEVFIYVDQFLSDWISQHYHNGFWDTHWKNKSTKTVHPGEIKLYYRKFMSAVNVRFHPFKIQFKITQVKIGHPEFVRQEGPKPNYIILDNTLYRMAKYFAKPKKADTYDIVLYMTSKMLSTSTSSNMKLPYTFLGSSFVGGACQKDKGKYYGVAIIQDLGTYSGVQSAVQNIGHLLGADKNGCNNECNDIYSANIMTDNFAHKKWRRQKLNFNWTECAKKRINKFINSESKKGKCLYKTQKPKSKDKLTLIVWEELISTIPTLKDQCVGIKWAEAKTRGEKDYDAMWWLCGNDPCQSLMCQLRHSWCHTMQLFLKKRDKFQMDCCDSKGPAMEGSRCDINGTVSDHGGYCKKGECVGMNHLICS